MSGPTVRAGAGPLGLFPDSLRLWWRFLPQLLAIALLGTIAHSLLIEGAVTLGYVNRLAGLVSLTLVVLVDLVVVVALFETVRPALPSIAAASRADAAPAIDVAAPEPEGFAGRLAAVLSLALVPFFAYYAAWGFLGDTIRSYSRAGLARANPFDPAHSGPLLDVSGGWWLVASVALLWGIRRIAKALKARSGAAIWSLLIVLCEAGWAFVGIYVIADWKGGLLGWLAERRIGDVARDAWQAISHPVGLARAAGAAPVEQTPPGVIEALTALFFYALLPVVWLTLAALIYRYDVHRSEAGELTARIRHADAAVARWQALPKWLRDFLGHFWAGTLKRYRALANSVRLTFASGLVSIVVLIVLYRAIDWASAWAWLGLVQLIGPRPDAVWEMIGSQLSVLLGSPSWPGDGVLPQTLKICLLAAALERAFAAGRAWRTLR